LFEEDFMPNITRLAGLVRPNTKLIVLTHPNNPTGSVISERELLEIAELAERNDAYLLHDETYRELSFEKPPPPAAVLSDHAISMTTMSKAYGLPGIRIGWIAGPKQVIEEVRKVREQITICNSALGEAIATYVLRQRSSRLEEVRKTVWSNFEILRAWMHAQNTLEWVAPKGGVVAFPRMKIDRSTEELCQLLVTNYRTFTIPGYCFEMKRHMRLGFGCGAPELKAGLERVEKAMNELGG
jgi:aspartate/methionine/tyrosine aminotransferase